MMMPPNSRYSPVFKKTSCNSLPSISPGFFLPLPIAIAIVDVGVFHLLK